MLEVASNAFLNEFKCVYEEESQSSFDNFLFYFNQQCEGVEFKGKRVLEIGCGKGFLSLYIALTKDAQVVHALDEAEGEGSEVNVMDSLEDLARAMQVKNLRIVKSDICLFEPQQPYDLIIANNSLHHVCEHGLLTWDIRATKKYIEVLSHIRAILAANGIVLIHEYSRHSIWRWIKRPKYKDIEWSLHPSKREWERVSRLAGFTVLSSEYVVPQVLQSIGPLITNGVAMFFHYPNFYIRLGVR